jgi:hypothetical protein
MPFSRLSALSKVGNLGADVVRLAALETDRQVAALSTDPVKLGIYPFTGSGSKVINVSLHEASHVALIDKMVAVVKSGDDLWALLDIKHTAKLDQVGRDARALYNCPLGGSAFAIGWDGQGAELVLQNNDVESRSFVLRGDVRGCDVGVEATYVTIDGDGGGKFRVHPGKTPESGAMGRADLPIEARELDQLAGGPDLSVAYRKGSSSVCIIRRIGAGGLEAKMVGLGSSVAAVAVSASSMFVASEDGKLGLYNSDTLHRASQAPTEATNTLDLRASGAPTCVLATTKGGSRVWVGTRDGDVLRCDAARGDMQL